MPTDRQLFEKLGKLINAADEEAKGQSDEYRNSCFYQIYDKFKQIHEQIKTPISGYYDDDDSCEEKIRSIYRAYSNCLWLIDVMDEIDAPDEGPGSEDDDEED